MFYRNKHVFIKMPQSIMKKDAIIIGAGVSGLSTAKGLQAAGLSVGVLEKSRGTGGRLSSKRLMLAESDKALTYDLGASGFHAISKSFQAYLTELEQRKIVRKFDDQYVGIPRNSSFTRFLSKDLDILFSQKVSRVEHNGSHWVIYGHKLDTEKSQIGQHVERDEIPLAVCKRIIFSAPAEQTLQLLPPAHSAKHWLTLIKSQIAFVTTFVLDSQISEPGLTVLQAQLMAYEPIKEVSFEHLKPSRECHSFVVIKLTSTHTWGHTHENTAVEVVSEIFKRLLLIEFKKLNDDGHTVLKEHTHRWLYSQYDHLIGHSKGYLSFDDGISIVGDYFEIEGEPLVSDFDTKQMAGVERSYLSAQRLLLNLHSMAYQMDQTQNKVLS